MANGEVITLETTSRIYLVLINIYEALFANVFWICVDILTIWRFVCSRFLLQFIVIKFSIFGYCICVLCSLNCIKGVLIYFIYYIHSATQRTIKNKINATCDTKCVSLTHPCKPLVRKLCLAGLRIVSQISDQHTDRWHSIFLNLSDPLNYIQRR